MTLRTAILRAVNGTFYARTNAGLAYELDRPQPSVRRMTRQLTEEGLLDSATYANINEFRITPKGTRAARLGN